jgi:hypothetical protein
VNRHRVRAYPERVLLENQSEGKPATARRDTRAPAGRTPWCLPDGHGRIAAALLSFFYFPTCSDRVSTRPNGAELFWLADVFLNWFE